jgi:hypothetical protein
VKGGIVATPRPVPGRLLPAAGGALVVALALVVFLVAGWSLAGWALGAVLWAGLEAVDLLLARARRQTAGTTSSGVLAFGLVFKTTAALAVLVAAAAGDSAVALGAVVVFGLAYTFELALSLVSYFGQER